MRRSRLCLNVTASFSLCLQFVLHCRAFLLQEMRRSRLCRMSFASGASPSNTQGEARAVMKVIVLLSFKMLKNVLSLGLAHAHTCMHACARSLVRLSVSSGTAQGIQQHIQQHKSTLPYTIHLATHRVIKSQATDTKAHSPMPNHQGTKTLPHTCPPTESSSHRPQRSHCQNSTWERKWGAKSSSRKIEGRWCSSWWTHPISMVRCRRRL